MERLAKLLGVAAGAITFTSLQSTDALWKYINDNAPFREASVARRTQKRYLYAASLAEAKRVVEDIRGSFKNTPVILLHESSMFTGGVEVDLDLVLSRAFQLFELDGDDLVILATDFSTGLMAEHFTDRTQGGPQIVYRVAAWQDT